MADFCAECTELRLGGPRDLNDFRRPPVEKHHGDIRVLEYQPVVQRLCEGCGWGWFDWKGERVR